MARNDPQVRKNYETIANNYLLKHKKVFDNYLKQRKSSRGFHWEDPWYSDYVGYHKELMNSPFAKYNYNNDPPLSLEESWGWE